MSNSKRRRAGIFLLIVLFCIAIVLFVSSSRQSQFSEYWRTAYIISVSLNFLGLFVIYRLLHHIGWYKEKYEKVQRKIADIRAAGNGEVLISGNIYPKVGTWIGESGGKHYDDSSASNYDTGITGDRNSSHDEISKNATAEIEVIHQNRGEENSIFPIAEPKSTDSVASGPWETPGSSKLAVKDFLATLVEEYNKARTDWTLQSQFLDTYRHAWFYVENSMARRQSPNAAPLFVTYDNGFYMAVETREQQGIYYVFPRFGVSYSESVHGPGAMGKVFKPCNYSHNESYDTIEVIEPALFFRKDAQSWSFEKSGSIKLML